MPRARSATTSFVIPGLLLLATGAPGDPPTWQTGDLFIAVGGGMYDVYSRFGHYKHSLEREGGGYTSDCGFSPDLRRLATTDYTHSQVVVFEEGNPEAPLTISTGQVSPGGHAAALIFDRDGNLLVGHPDGNRLLHKYDPGGTLIETYEVLAEERGSNWLDLAVDQSTVFYTSQGRSIHRYDTASRTQLSPFAELPGDGHAQAIRLLPPGDGSGGLLVADGADVKRLDGRGEVIQTYDLPQRDGWFAINLVPDGQAFWATEHHLDEVVRFHIDTGLVEGRFSAGEGQSVFGVCVKGELTAAVPPAAGLPTAYGLGQNSPNPFNPETQITYRLPEPGHVSLSIYNVLGQHVHTLVDDQRPSGRHTLTWDGRDSYGRDASSGVYLYRMTSAGLVETRRMLLLK